MSAVVTKTYLLLRSKRPNAKSNSEPPLDVKPSSLIKSVKKILPILIGPQQKEGTIGKRSNDDDIH
jgi:hypothetical protein